MNRIASLLLIAGLALWSPAAAFSAETAEGVLTGIKGSGEVKKRGEKEWIDAYDKMKISSGDMVSTGIDGKATMLFKNSETKIQPLTQFAIGRSAVQESEMYTELFLLSGKISSHVFKTKLTGIKNKFNVVTPTAVVGVRGTIQTVEAYPGMGPTADIKDGKGYAAPLPADKFPPAVLELLGLLPDTGISRDTETAKGADRK